MLGSKEKLLRREKKMLRSKKKADARKEKLLWSNPKMIRSKEMMIGIGHSGRQRVRPSFFVLW